MLKIEAVNACGVNSGTVYTQAYGGDCYPQDIDGCQARGTAPPADSLVLTASPNPTKDRITVELKRTAEPKSSENPQLSTIIQRLLIVNNAGNPVITQGGNRSSKKQVYVGRLTAGTIGFQYLTENDGLLPFLLKNNI